MGRMLDAFPTETLILHKKDGTTAEVTALVDDDMIHCDDASVIIEEDDIYERTLPNGAKEYYRIIDRGFYKGAHGIPDNYQSKVQKISKSIAEKMMVEVKEKPHKLFISHSSKDKPYMEALSEMLEDIGMPDGSFVCTSVAGHGIPGGAKIYDWLRDQFLKCDLRVLFVLSRNYYESAASLNEMGAAWVTKVSDTLLLLPGFDFSDIKGCVDPREMGISFGMDDDELTVRRAVHVGFNAIIAALPGSHKGRGGVFHFQPAHAAVGDHQGLVFLGQTDGVFHMAASLISWPPCSCRS